MNIYVANLSYKIQDEDLKEIFEEYGAVNSAKVIIDHTTGKSRGFAFVEMANDAEGQEAIDQLNNAELDGKNLTVNKAKPKEANGNRGGGGGGFNRGGGGGYNRGGGGGGYNREGGNDRGGDRSRSNSRY
ncbi:MAG: RNA recognition motif domain-containing protein [Bacteroidales bacterium]